MNIKQNIGYAAEIFLALVILGITLLYPESFLVSVPLLVGAYIIKVVKDKKNKEYRNFLESILFHNGGNHEAVYAYLKKIEKKIKKNFSFYREILEPMYVRDFISESYNCNKITALATIAKRIENNRILGEHGKEAARYALHSIGDYLSRDTWRKEYYQESGVLEIDPAARNTKAISFILFIINNNPRPNAWEEFGKRQTERYWMLVEQEKKAGRPTPTTDAEASALMDKYNGYKR